MTPRTAAALTTFAFAVAAAMAAACSPGGSNVPAATTAIEYRNGHWFDGEGFRAGTWYAVDGVFTHERPQQIDASHDLRGGHVLPPLADAHNHNLQNPWGVTRMLGHHLDAGVQYAAMLCGNADSAGAARDALEGAPIDVLQAAACISSSDGHPLRMARSNPDGSLRPVEEVHDHLYVVMDTEADIERKWPLVQAAQPDLVKAILVHSERPQRRGQARYHGLNGLAPELLAPLVRKAHAEGLRVAAHVESAADFKVAVEAGVDIIAHLPGYQLWDGHEVADYRLDDASIARAARASIPVIATANAAVAAAGDDVEKLAQVQALQKQNLQRLMAAGVPIAIGSDRFDGSADIEFHYLSGLEVMAPAQLLRSAVETTPRLLFPQRRIGRIAEGYEASFVVVDGDPLDDPQALARIRLRVRQGVVY